MIRTDRHRPDIAPCVRLQRVLVAAIWLAASSLPATWSATIELFPGSSFEAAVENLNPGDILIVHEGTYSDSGRISIDVRGTPSNPVVIMGAAGRDFHNFNVVYRDDPATEVVAFTAAQIPKIAGRRYPAALAGAILG